MSLMLFHYKKLLALGAAGLFQASPLQAMGLLQAYEAALENDPVYRAAVYEKNAGEQYEVLGRSSLLPSLSANYGQNRNSADISTSNAVANRDEHRSYTSSAGSIQLRQPIIHMEGWARYRQGVAQTQASDAQFSLRSQELIVRLVSVYAAAKYAEDQLALATAQRLAYTEQRAANQHMFEHGEGSRTDMLETEAKYDLAVAQEIEANDALTDARKALSAIVGQPVTMLDSLSEDFRIPPMSPAGLAEWEETALQVNPDINAQRYSVEAARQEIAKSRSGHVPRLDLVASVNKNKSDTINTFNQDATVRSIGVQLTIPLYSGGAVSALTQQAVSNYQKAMANLEAKTREVLVELNKQYSVARSSAHRIDALLKAVRSASLLIEATQKSVAGGVRTNLDVLLAQQQLFQARRDLTQARYNYLISYLKLRFAAGTVGMDDLQNVSSYFLAGR